MPLCYQQLTLADRRRLYHLRERKVPINEMARQLGRHRSTINREIRRNIFRDHGLPEYYSYFSTKADDLIWSFSHNGEFFIPAYSVSATPRMPPISRFYVLQI